MFPCLACCYECGCYGITKKSESALNGKSDVKCLNFCCAPFALIMHSVYAYFIRCVWVYFARFMNHVFCYPCVHQELCSGCYLYNDKKFKATDESLGLSSADNSLVWKRAGEVIDKPILFQKGVEPGDVIQGTLGNCWLLSALACAAEFPGLIDKIFINRERSSRGKYQVKLFNGYMERWEVITVDDKLPVKEMVPEGFEENDNKEEGEGDIESSRPNKTYEFYFARPKENELWVPILEKAFAKFRGNYKNLEGGNMLWAFHVLTGDHSFRLRKCTEESRDGVWEKLVLANDEKPDEIKSISVVATNESIRNKDLFGLLRAYDRSKALIGASMNVLDKENKDGQHKEETDEETGLIRGHAYSLIQAKKVKDGEVFELVQLRNPWGSLEWKGAWSDESEEWEKYADIARTLEFNKDSNDGTFWMLYSDFIKYFDNIDICDRTVDYSDFSLDVHEDSSDCFKHFCGPTQGCLEGCADFWCKCKGVKFIYCGNESHIIMKKAIKGRDDTFFAEAKAL